MNATNYTIEDELLEDVKEQFGESFVIDDDEKANWAVKKIANTLEKAAKKRSECKRWIEHYMQQVEKINAKAETETANLKNMLFDYFSTVEPDKDLKTKREYTLPDGVLRMIKPTVEYSRDDKALTDWAKKNAPDCVKVKESPDWTAIKKDTTVDGGTVIYKPTGEIIEGVTVTERPGRFEVVEG